MKYISRIQLPRWTKHQSALEVRTEVGSRLCGSKAAMTSDRVVSDLMLPLWDEVLWPFLDAWDSVRPRTTSTQWNLPRKYGPYGELFLVGERADGPQGADSAGAQHPAAWRASLPFDAEEAFVPDSEAFNSFIGDGFLVPELKGGSEASQDEHADNASNEALYVIGLHGSGDKISRYLQDWEVAKVALSCHIAVDMLCQEVCEVERSWLLNEPVG